MRTTCSRTQSDMPLIYSLMRESDLSDNDYLDHFYDDEKECRQKVGELT
jgi:hypothetical protein